MRRGGGAPKPLEEHDALLKEEGRYHAMREAQRSRASRVPLLAGLARSETSQAREALEELADDPDLGKDARALLG
jgi:hypothetical protein